MTSNMQRVANRSRLWRRYWGCVPSSCPPFCPTRNLLTVKTKLEFLCLVVGKFEIYCNKNNLTSLFVNMEILLYLHLRWKNSKCAACSTQRQNLLANFAGNQIQCDERIKSPSVSGA